MIAPKHREEILQFINGNIAKVKQEYPFVAIPLLVRKPDISSLAKEIPQCVMNYTLRDIIDFLISAQQEGKIFF